jgi:hypothetical protein
VDQRVTGGNDILQVTSRILLKQARRFGFPEGIHRWASTQHAAHSPMLPDALDELSVSAGVKSGALSGCHLALRDKRWHLFETLSRSSDSRWTSASRARTHSALLPCGAVVATRPHDGHSPSNCDGKASTLSTVASRESNRLAGEKARAFRSTCQRWRTRRREFNTRLWRVEITTRSLRAARLWRHSVLGC